MEDATLKISREGEVVVPWTTKVALGVEELRVKLPDGVMVKIVAPVEVLITNILLLPAAVWWVTVPRLFTLK